MDSDPEIKSIVWILQLTLPSNYHMRLANTFATAFSVDNNGLIMTSARLFANHTYEITGRKLDDRSFLYKVEVVEIKSKWNIALLRVRNASSCSIGRFAIDSSLFMGQTVLHIGHPDNFVGTLTAGKVVFPCVNDVHIPLDDQNCGNYTCTAMNITPPYRIMGNIWNTDSWRGAGQDNHVFERQLHPQTPIIQMRGLGFREGCSGGPVFNTEGEIVGMMCMSYLGFEIAIHGSLLRKVLSEIGEQGGNNKQDSSQAGSSEM